MNTQDHLYSTCHGEHKQTGRTTFIVEGGYVMYHTDWLEDSVAEKLELIIEQARQKNTFIMTECLSTTFQLSQGYYP